MKQVREGDVKFYRCILLFLLIILFQFTCHHQASAQEDIWVTAYYAGWSQGCGYPGHLQPEQIDYSAVTHIIHFAVIPNANGSLDYSSLCITPENSQELVQEAHAAGKKVILSIGGWQTESGFLGATRDGIRAQFINNLVGFMVSRGYDGLDIDWEPLSESSFPRYRIFIAELKNALNKVDPNPFLTVAVSTWQPSLFVDIQQYFDQINIMTYDMSGPWLGSVTWHNASLYDGGHWFPSFDGPAPSANGAVENYREAGIDSSKLGIGIAFFGYVWRGGNGTSTGGVTEPAQTYTGESTIEVLTYFDIMDRYYQSRYYRWDSTALASYLSIDNEGSADDRFISYDDETACYEKIAYVKNEGLGGVIVFELGGGWRPSEPVPDALLQSIKDAWGGPVEPYQRFLFSVRPLMVQQVFQRARR